MLSESQSHIHELGFLDCLDETQRAKKIEGQRNIWKVPYQVSAAQLSVAQLSANNSAPHQLSAATTERHDN
jgi:hypothetical protein